MRREKPAIKICRRDSPLHCMRRSNAHDDDGISVVEERELESGDLVASGRVAAREEEWTAA